MKSYQKDFLKVVEEREAIYNEEIENVLANSEDFAENGELMVDQLQEELNSELFSMCVRFLNMGGTYEEAVEVFGEYTADKVY